MKKLLGITALMTILMTGLCYGGDGISITVDGNPLETDTPAQVIEGRTMVPLRAIFEAVGADVRWDSTDKSISANKGDTSIGMKIDSSLFEVNGEEKSLDVPPQIINGRTMVPARAVAESLDCDVEWDNVSKTVIIITVKNVETTTEVTTEVTTETVTETTTEPIWIQKLMSHGKKPNKIDYGKFTNEMTKEYHLKTRKMFEDTCDLSLSKADYGVGDTVYGSVLNNFNKPIEEAISEIWEYNCCGLSPYDVYGIPDESGNHTEPIDNLKEYFEEIGEKWDFPSDFDDFDYNKFKSYVKRFQNDCFLTLEININCCYTKYGQNACALLLSMADEEEVGYCSYIVVFFNKDNEYVTYRLVKNEDETYSLKEGNEVIKTGLENDKKAFLISVDELIRNNTDFAK